MAKKKLTFIDLVTAFKHGNYEPLYLVYGEERFFIDSLQDLLLSNALGPGEKDFNLDILYGAEIDVQSAMSTCASFPMMAERRVVIIRDFDRIKDNRRFVSYAENPNPTAIVFLVCSGKPNMSSHPYRAIREHGLAVEFKSVYANQVGGWIKRLAQERGYRMEPRAVQMLADFVGSDLKRGVSELEKIATFAGGRDLLTADDVVQASGQTREFNVFELQSAVGEMRHFDALRIAERLLQQSSNPRGECTMIVSVLASFFSKLWHLTGCQREHLTEKEMARRVGVSPFFIKEYLAILRRYNVKSLSRSFQALLSADYELKGGSTRSERLVLDLLLRRILAPEKPAMMVA